MKRKTGKGLMFAILTALFAGTVLVFPARAWPPATNPYLEVRDDGSVDGVADNKVVFDEFTPAVGVDFYIDVYLMDIDATWYLNNASFVLKYDPAVITVVWVVVDPVWTGPNLVGVIPGEINMFVQNPVPPAYGDMLIATIQFRVVNQEVSPPFPSGHYDYSPLDFQDIIFWRSDSIIPHEPPVNGEVFVYALEGAAVPEFPLTVPVLTSLTAILYLALRKRIGKNPE